MKMVEIGTNMAGDPVYNVINEDGTLYKTTIYTKTEADAIVIGDTSDPDIIEAIIVDEDASDYSSMSKIELEKLMRMHDVELDRRKTKEQLLEEVTTFFEENKE
tara:strand:- start:39 stop:350 length:312 start_codon:yes stop_codon:yes gene_type:complete